MKYTKRFLSAALMVTAVLSLTVSAHAADYSFTTDAPADYYPSSAYEDVYGSQYNWNLASSPPHRPELWNGHASPDFRTRWPL